MLNQPLCLKPVTNHLQRHPEAQLSEADLEDLLKHDDDDDDNDKAKRLVTVTYRQAPVFAARFTATQRKSVWQTLQACWQGSEQATRWQIIKTYVRGTQGPHPAWQAFVHQHPALLGAMLTLVERHQPQALAHYLRALVANPEHSVVLSDAQQRVLLTWLQKSDTATNVARLNHLATDFATCAALLQLLPVDSEHRATLLGLLLAAPLINQVLVSTEVLIKFAEGLSGDEQAQLAQALTEDHDDLFQKTLPHAWDLQQLLTVIKEVKTKGTFCQKFADLHTNLDADDLDAILDGEDLVDGLLQKPNALHAFVADVDALRHLLAQLDTKAMRQEYVALMQQGETEASGALWDRIVQHEKSEFELFGALKSHDKGDLLQDLLQTATTCSDIYSLVCPNVQYFMLDYLFEAARAQCFAASKTSVLQLARMVASFAQRYPIEAAAFDESMLEFVKALPQGADWFKTAADRQQLYTLLPTQAAKLQNHFESQRQLKKGKTQASLPNMMSKSSPSGFAQFEDEDDVEATLVVPSILEQSELLKKVAASPEAFLQLTYLTQGFEMYWLSRMFDGHPEIIQRCFPDPDVCKRFVDLVLQTAPLSNAIEIVEPCSSMPSSSRAHSSKRMSSHQLLAMIICHLLNHQHADGVERLSSTDLKRCLVNKAVADALFETETLDIAKPEVCDVLIAAYPGGLLGFLQAYPNAIDTIKPKLERALQVKIELYQDLEEKGNDDLKVYIEQGLEKLQQVLNYLPHRRAFIRRIISGESAGFVATAFNTDNFTTPKAQCFLNQLRLEYFHNCFLGEDYGRAKLVSQFLAIIDQQAWSDFFMAADGKTTFTEFLVVLKAEAVSLRQGPGNIEQLRQVQQLIARLENLAATMPWQQEEVGLVGQTTSRVKQLVSSYALQCWAALFEPHHARVEEVATGPAPSHVLSC